MTAPTVLDMLRHNGSMVGKLPDEPLLNGTLRFLAKWRAGMVARTILVRDGPLVQSGPFAGMTYLDRVAEGAFGARLLGSYESELHPHIEAFIAEDLDYVVDIGCAEGFYAVGLARRMPRASILAYDISEPARQACRELAALNGMTDRIVVGGEFKGEDFARFVDTKALIFVDIEGAEDQLLDPVRHPALQRLSIIVETHPGARPGITETLIQRFAATHVIEQVDHSPRMPPHNPWLQKLSNLDLILAIWEWREGPTPWLVMRPRPSA